MNILIANLGDPSSLGNILTLNSLKKIIKENVPDAKITIHSSNPGNKDKRITVLWNRSLYSYLLMKKRGILIKVLRYLKFIYYLYSPNFKASPALKDKFSAIISDYYRSDLILFIGNSNLKTTNSFKSLIEMITYCLIVKFAHKTCKNVVILPVTFGPFRYNFHKNIALRGIRNADTIFTRDENSFTSLNKVLAKKVSRSCDLILFSDIAAKKVSSGNKLRVGVTFRNWLDRNFENFEIDLVETFFTLDKTKKISFVPILIDPSVDKHMPEQINFKKFEKYANSSGLNINKELMLKSIGEINKCLKNLDFMISLRTNSTLLSVAAGLPLIAFSKHKKVKLIMKDLGLSKYFKEPDLLNTPDGKNKLIDSVISREKERSVLDGINSKIIPQMKRNFIKVFKDSYK